MSVERKIIYDDTLDDYGVLIGDGLKNGSQRFLMIGSQKNRVIESDVQVGVLNQGFTLSFKGGPPLVILRDNANAIFDGNSYTSIIGSARLDLSGSSYIRGEGGGRILTYGGELNLLNQGLNFSGNYGRTNIVLQTLDASERLSLNIHKGSYLLNGRIVLNKDDNGAFEEDLTDNPLIMVTGSSRIVVADTSKVDLFDNSRIELADDAYIKAFQNAYMRLSDDAKLNISQMGHLNITDIGYVGVHNGARMLLTNGAYLEMDGSALVLMEGTSAQYFYKNSYQLMKDGAAIEMAYWDEAHWEAMQNSKAAAFIGGIGAARLLFKRAPGPYQDSELYLDDKLMASQEWVLSQIQQALQNIA